MKCTKKGCNIEIEPENFTDDNRIEQHHLHPSFMGNPQGKGKLLDLCIHHHIEVLHPLILEIIRSHSNLLNRRNNSADWIWRYHVLGNKKEKCIKEVINFTLKWLEEDDNDYS